MEAEFSRHDTDRVGRTYFTLPGFPCVIVILFFESNEPDSDPDAVCP